MGERSGGFLKWVAGIVGAVLTGVLIWLLTNPTSPLHEQSPPESTPILKIVGISSSNAVAGGTANADVEVYNEGSSTAEACSVWWYSGSQVADRLEQGHEPGEASTSEPFGLTPGERKTVSVTSLAYDEPGSFRSELEVICSGYDVVSQRFVEYVIVR